MAEALGFSAVTKIVSSAVGLVCNKLYDGVTNQLKDGDVAKESLHDMIVRDLNGIKSTLDCLSLKDLEASYSFLKEGIRLLNLAIDSPGKDGNECPPGEASRFLKDSASDILKEASSLPKATKGLYISSKERFLSARERFGDSRKEATRAFNNKSLSTENRIMACKLRVAATILQSGLEDPQAAVAACLVSLKELHGLPGIQDRCSVFLKGGGFFTSRYKAEERLEHIMSVLFINHALFDFASKHSSEYPNVFTWPGIELKDRKVNPILHATDILKKTSRDEEVSRQLVRVVISETGLPRISDIAVNSRGETVVLEYDKIMVIKNTGECQDVGFCQAAESFVVFKQSIAIDSNDDLYVVSYGSPRDRRTEQNFVLHIFDENCNLRYETNLDFLPTEQLRQWKIAVDKNKNIIIILSCDNQVYVCNSEGQLKFQFERGSSCSMGYSLSFTNNNDIMIPSDNRHSVHVYTTEGNLKCTFKAPGGHQIKDVAFHHGIGKVIVLTYAQELRRKSLLCYSETGKLEYSEVFNEQDLLWQMDIAGHCSGPFVVHWRDSVSFI